MTSKITRINKILLLRSADLDTTRKAIYFISGRFPKAKIYVLSQTTVTSFFKDFSPSITIIEFPYRDFNLSISRRMLPTLPFFDLSLAIYRGNGDGYDEVDAFLLNCIRSEYYGCLTENMDLKYKKCPNLYKLIGIIKGKWLLYNQSIKGAVRSFAFNVAHSSGMNKVVLGSDSRIVTEGGGRIVLGKRAICRVGYLPGVWEGVRGREEAVIRIHRGASFECSGSINLFTGVKINVLPGAHLKINEGTYIAFNSKIFTEKEIYIGKNCAISWDVEISDSDFHRIEFGDRKVPKSGIEIGDHSWIGAGSRIMKGVVLGKNVVVGAGSVVTKAFPDHSIIAGNPAVIIGKKSTNIRV